MTSDHILPMTLGKKSKEATRQHEAWFPADDSDHRSRSGTVIRLTEKSKKRPFFLLDGYLRLFAYCNLAAATQNFTISRGFLLVVRLHWMNVFSDLVCCTSTRTGTRTVGVVLPLSNFWKRLNDSGEGAIVIEPPVP